MLDGVPYVPNKTDTEWYAREKLRSDVLTERNEC